jgi:hypothetical protein
MGEIDLPHHQKSPDEQYQACDRHVGPKQSIMREACREQRDKRPGDKRAYL